MKVVYVLPLIRFLSPEATGVHQSIMLPFYPIFVRIHFNVLTPSLDFYTTV